MGTGFYGSNDPTNSVKALKEDRYRYSGRKGRDGQKKKTGKANERKGEVKRGKDE